MSIGLRILWLVYLAGTAAVAVLSWAAPRSDPPDGAGGGTACACLGFAVFLVLAFATGWERWTGRRDRDRRGFDVIR